MNKINDGGAAFPHIAAEGHRDYRGGMSVRTWLAGQALAGLCANPGGPFQANGSSGWGMVNCEIPDIARDCLALADAVIAAGAHTPDKRTVG